MTNLYGTISLLFFPEEVSPFKSNLKDPKNYSKLWAMVHTYEPSTWKVGAED